MNSIKGSASTEFRDMANVIQSSFADAKALISEHLKESSGFISVFIKSSKIKDVVQLN